MRSGRGQGTHRGFAYVLLLIAVAVLAVTAAATLSLGAAMARRDAERQLLAVGMEYQAALRSYASVPSGAGQPMAGHGPRTLEDLLRDPRAPGVRRHLRHLYADPLTGQPLGLVRDAEGFISGVYSQAQGRPIQQELFEPALAHFTGAESYAKWVFGLPSVLPGGGVTRSSPTVS